jgi:hypothetical protein
MKRIILLLIISISTFGCSEDPGENEKLVKFSNEKTVRINFQIKPLDDRENILVVEYRNREKVIREETVENEVLKIWQAVEGTADEFEIEEGIIKYEYLAGIGKKTKKEVYKTLLFTSEKIENGTWKIRKVN